MRGAKVDLAALARSKHGMRMMSRYFTDQHHAHASHRAVIATRPDGRKCSAPGCISRLWLPVLLLAACSTQQPASVPGPSAKLPATQNKLEEAALLRYVTSQDRLYRIAAPLLVKNASLCQQHARLLLGFTAKNRYSYSSAAADLAKNLFRLGERLQVTNVLDDSGAQQAGIRRGDILLKMQDQTFPQGPNAEPEAAKMLATKLRNQRKLSVTVSRDDKAISLDIPLTFACAYSVDIGNAGFVHAYSDGRRILITRGMMDYFQADSELATIIAREMAHNTLQHSAALQIGGTVAGVIDQLLPMQPDLSGLKGSAGIKTMPSKMDQEADRLALYMLARAGYDPAAAAPTLQRLAAAYPASVPNSYTAQHPLSADRLRQMQSTLELIRQKQAARQALIP